MLATFALEHTLAAADLKLSASAAIWAALFPGRSGLLVGAVQLETAIASLYNDAMSPRRSRTIRSLMVFCMLCSSLLLFVEGANMSISKWNKSHQKGAGSVGQGVPSMFSKLTDAARMLRMMSPLSSRNFILLLFFRKSRHVDRKSGGL